MASDFQSFAASIGAHLQDRLYRAEVEAEVLDYLELAAADLEAAGLSPEEARRQAEAAFGDPALVGRLLRNTPKGGDSFMKFARIGGLCGILAGIFRVLAMVASIFERILADPAPASDLVRTAGLVIRVVDLLPFPLFLLALAGTYAYLPGSRTQKRFLIVVQMAGVVAAFWSRGNLAFVSGFLVLNAGTLLAGIPLVWRKRNPELMLGAALIVAGLGLLPFTPLVFALVGSTLSYIIGGISAAAWMLIGFILLAGDTAQPKAPIRVAN